MNVKEFLEESFFASVVYACFAMSLLELFVIISRSSFEVYMNNNQRFVTLYFFLVITLMRPVIKKLRKIMFGR